MARKNVSLVVGAQGLAGATLVKFLLEQDEKVRVLGEDVQRPKSIPATVDYMDCDLTWLKSVKPALENVKAVYNALLHTDSMDANALSVRNLCQAAMEAEVRRFIHLSSAMVYGAKPVELPSRETTEPNPQSPSEHLFVDAEAEVNNFMGQGLKAIILRPLHIYGPGGIEGVNRLIAVISTGFMPIMPREAARSRTHFIYSEDLARAAYFLAGQRKALGETFNVADDVVRPFSEIIGQICDITGVPQPAFRASAGFMSTGNRLLENLARTTKTKPMLATETIELMSATSILDNFKLKSLGFRLEWPDSVEGFKQTVEWLRKRGYLRNPLRLMGADS